MTQPMFDPKDMPFRRLGNSGLRVPLFSYGGWLTLGGTVNDTQAVKTLMQTAWDHGCNYFDNAEVYSSGRSEIQTGLALKELNWKRSDYMIATKIFFGTGRKDYNSKGLSRKHIIEGLRESLQRLQLEYVDVVHAHRADVSVPMEEIVKAFSWCIDQGMAYYWGTSEWSAAQIAEAIAIADKRHLHAPIVEQPQYSMLHRDRFEVEYMPLFEQYRYGSTIWSPLKSGILTGKYNDGIPAGSRFDTNKSFFHETAAKLEAAEGKAEIEKVRALTKVAERLGCAVSQVALAWAASHPHVSTVILGATTPEQLKENFGALGVIDKLTPAIKAEIEQILDNKPQQPSRWGR